jgi:hypothetical protein
VFWAKVLDSLKERGKRKVPAPKPPELSISPKTTQKLLRNHRGLMQTGRKEETLEHTSFALSSIGRQCGSDKVDGSAFGCQRR